LPREVPDDYPHDSVPAYGLKWACGPRSVFRSCEVNPLLVYGFRGVGRHKQVPLQHPAVLITGHGAGRWYNYHAGHHFVPTTSASRAILVQGTNGPLRFYNFEPQGGDGDAVAEIRGSRHVSVFGCKTECNTTFLRIVDSDHIRVIGHGGIGNAAPGGALYEVLRTPNFLLANLADQVNLGPRREYYGGHGIHLNIESFFPLRVDQPGRPAQVIASLERPVLYRWGRPQDHPGLDARP